MPMRDLAILTPALVSILAQTADSASWERMGYSGIGLGLTAFMWKYFNAREEKAASQREEKEKEAAEERKRREDLDKEERNRLLEANNELTAQVVSLLKEQATKADKVASLLVQSQQTSSKTLEDSIKSLKDITRKVKGPPSGFLAQEEIDPTD